VILAIAPHGDDHLRAVGDALDALGAPWRSLDLASFSEEAAITLGYGLRQRRSFDLQLPGGEPLPLDRLRGVWWRRPGSPALDPRMGPTHRHFAEMEWQHALAGLWQALPCRWVNPPLADQAASRKTWQLAVAQEVGLAIPRTLVTSDPAAARAFLRERGRRPTVYKAFSASQAAWRFTRLVGPAERRILDQVRHAPVIFQEYVEAERDLRIFAVGGRLLAAEIDGRKTDYPLDYRADFDRARVEPCRLPPGVTRGLRALVRRLGLRYAAIDMRRRRDGEHVFLEANPSGQWLFVEQRTGLPVTRAMARLLAGR